MDTSGESERLLTKSDKSIDGLPVYGTSSQGFDVFGEKSGAKKNADQTRRSVSLFTLFRYATCKDWFLMVLGSLAAIIHGAGWPMLAVVFGTMTNTFIRQVQYGFYDETTADTLVPNASTVSFTTNGIIVNLSSSVKPLLQPEDDTFEAISVDAFGKFMSNFALYYIYIGVGVFVATYTQIACWTTACERQIHKLRQEFFYQVLRQEISWFDMHQSGELSMQLNDDIERIKEGIGDKCSIVIECAATFFAGFFVGFAKGWELTLVIMSLTPLLALSAALMGKIIVTSVAREQEKYAIAGGVAEEVLGNIRTVSAFCGQKREITRYAVALLDGMKTGIRKYHFLAVAIGFSFLLLYASYALGFWYGSKLILAGRMDPGSVFTVFFAVMVGSFALGNAVPHITAIATAKGCAVTIFDVIDSHPHIDPYSLGGAMLDTFQANIEFKNVFFSYPCRPTVPVLQGLSLTIKEGQTVALCGCSGSGKSTIISLLLRFYDPARGTITIDGHNVYNLNVQWLRSVIGVVSQEPVLFGCSIRDNIDYNSEGVSFEEIVKAAKMANAHDFIMTLPDGYNTLVGDRGAQLSGGQKQRVAIARALVRNPKILLLDEATSALDSHSEAIVQKALSKATEGRTTIIIAHRLSTIKDADVIYAIEDGVVKEHGTHQELMDKEGLYYQLVTNQTFIDEQGGSTTDTQSPFEPIPARKERKYTARGSISENWNLKPFTAEAEMEKLELPSNIQIIKLASKDWFLLVLGCISSVIVGATMPTFAVFYSEIFATFTQFGDELAASAFFWSMMFLVLGVVTGGGYWARTLAFAISGEKLTMRLRKATFGNVLRQDMGWFDDKTHSTGKLSTRLATDAPMVKSAAGSRIGSLLSAVVTMTLSLVIAFIFGWKLALILLVAVPLLLLATNIQTKIRKGNQQRDLMLMEDAGKVVSEALDGIRTVQALTWQQRFFDKFVENLMAPYFQNKKYAQVYSIAFAFSQGIMFMIYAAAFRLGAYLVTIEDMEPVDVYRVFFAMAFSAASAGEWSSYLPDYSKARLSAAQIIRLKSQEPVIDNCGSGGVRPHIKGEVTFSNVSFCYPSRKDVQVLQSLNLHIVPGQTLALVGPSGCGKSTVISLLERFYDPQHGQVKVDDFDIRTMNLPYLRSHIALVSQEPVLFNCSVRKNITYGLEEEVSQKKVEAAAKLANVHNFITGMPKGYSTVVGERGTQLSGGQKQRIAIARALIRDPRILLLDEATSALDTESEKLVQDALDVARKGRTCIIVAHRLSTIQAADWIVVIDKGQVAEQGTHEQLLLKKRLYYHLTKRQRINK